MFHFVLNVALEPDVKRFAKRHCAPAQYAIYRDTEGKLVAGFRDADRAMLFLNLFEGEIEQSFETTIKKAA